MQRRGEKREAPGIRSRARGTLRDDGEKEGTTTSDSSDTDRLTMGETEAKKPECKASVQRVCVQGRRRDTASAGLSVSACLAKDSAHC